jgi:hypothetical protein
MIGRAALSPSPIYVERLSQLSAGQSSGGVRAPLQSSISRAWLPALRSTPLVAADVTVMSACPFGGPTEDQPLTAVVRRREAATNRTLRGSLSMSIRDGTAWVGASSSCPVPTVVEERGLRRR